MKKFKSYSVHYPYGKAIELQRIMTEEEYLRNISFCEKYSCGYDTQVDKKLSLINLPVGTIITVNFIRGGTYTIERIE
jgi:hypothetical protein